MLVAISIVSMWASKKFYVLFDFKKKKQTNLMCQTQGNCSATKHFKWIEFRNIKSLSLFLLDAKTTLSYFISLPYIGFFFFLLVL